jgi:tRNA 5-methylaminomethyl-2-thiouridine biosynthesis bifunctional protein
MDVSLALVGSTLEWSEDGQPRSPDHHDVYFSTEDGLAETRHVFIDQNDLPGRWEQLPASADFVIGETGFGTGLNFLAAWRQWRRSAPTAARLHFLSVEAHPLAAEDLSRALGAFPELADLADELITAWPRAFARGLHRCRFDGGRVSLTLALDEVLPGLEAFLESTHPLYRRPRRGVDAWFLDGFAPARNPAMWREEVLDVVAALSSPGATFATFTAAGAVRRGLRAAGFEVRKVPGFGQKRDMSRGQRPTQGARHASDPAPEHFPASPFPDGLPHAWALDTESQTPGAGTRVAVLGAGLAGCHAAAALAARGFAVTLVDANAELASGGSGNRQGVLYARPANSGTAASRFNLMALLFAQRHYVPLWARQTDRAGARCGVLHLMRNEKDGASQHALVEALHRARLCQLLDATEARQATGVSLPAGGLWYPDSGWLSPPEVCRWQVESAAIARVTAWIAALDRADHNAWRLVDDQGQVRAEAETVVLACATGLAMLGPTQDLPVQAVRGQVTDVPLDPSDRANALRAAICAEGYVSPPLDRRLSFGASFVPNDADTTPRPGESQENLDRLRADIPGLLADHITASDCRDRVGLRCATPDRLPLVGPVPDGSLLERRFALLRKNARAAISAPGAWHRGLYVSAGYGSRGLAYVPLATEWLVADICGEPPPIDRALREALNPARFLIRDLKRNRR